MSERITEATDLTALANALDIRLYRIRSILRNNSNINDAAYQLLSMWRKKGINQKRSEGEMKETLRNALCSAKMNIIAEELKHYFQ